MHNQYFFGLKDYMKLSATARLMLQNLLAYLSSYSIASAHGKYTYKSALLNWTNKMKEYNDMAGLNSITSMQAKAMLVNVLMEVKALNDIRQQELLASKASGRTVAFTYEEYVSLALHVCGQLDANVVAKKYNNGKIKFHSFDNFETYLTKIEDGKSPFIEELDEDNNEEIEEIDDYSISKTKIGEADNGITIPKLFYLQLLSDAKEFWCGLKAKDKQLIYDSFTKPRTLAIKATDTNKWVTFKRDPINQQVNKSITDDNDNVDNKDSIEEDVDYTIASTTSKPDSLKKVFNAKREAKVSDITSVISTKTDGTKCCPLVPEYLLPKWDNKSYYYDIDTHEYVVSLIASRSNKNSLIDRGANGGVAGSNVRTISINDRSVSITGIDNHEMSNIPIGTVGSVVYCQHGEVIAIMPQYVITGKGCTIHSSTQFKHYKIK